jgi:hypothetical protein
VGHLVAARHLVQGRHPSQDRLQEQGGWLEEGNTVIIASSGEILAGPVRQREETLIADPDLGDVLSARRHLDPVVHYHRPDIFRLYVDTSPRPPVVETRLPGSEPTPLGRRLIKPETDLQGDLEVALPVLDAAARIGYLEPVEVVQGLRGASDGPPDGVVDAFGGGADDLAD